MKRKTSLKLFSLFIVLFLLHAPVFTQSKSNKMDWGKLKVQITEMMEEWAIPGLGIAIIDDGKVVFSEGFGLRDKKRRLKVTPRTLFPIASCTKTFTAISAAVLVDEGKLSWDKPVREYLSAPEFYDEYVTNHFTLRDLLAHRTGLPQHYRMYFNRNLKLKEIMERLRFLEPSRGFRECFQYANLNYAIAAYLIEQAANLNWKNFIRKKIFDPLEMINSNCSLDDLRKSGDFALPYHEKDGQVEEIPFFDAEATGIGAAGSINSNLADMANWILFQLSKGKFKDRRIVSEANLVETHRPQIVMPGSVSDEIFYSSYGLGWGITSYRNHLMLTHSGGFNGFSCQVSIMPRDNVGCVILCNKESTFVPSILTYAVYDRLLSLSEIPWNERMRERMAKRTKFSSKTKEEDNCGQDTKIGHLLEKYCGLFEHQAYGVMTVEIKGTLLQVTHNGLRSPLIPCSGDFFETTAEVFERFGFSFISDDGISIDRVAVSFEPSVNPIVFNRMSKSKNP